MFPFVLPALMAVLAWAPPSTQVSDADDPGAAGVATPGLDGQRRELLDIAFDAASAIPLMPHHKDRALTQLGVVETCLDLDQPELALAWAGEIRNWRRGEAYGDVARWLALHGRADEAPHCLELAGKVLDGPSGGEDWQTWQRDRIRARIASTHMALGQTEQARPFAAGLADSELQPIAEQRAQGASEEEADAFLRDVGAVFEGGSFEQVSAALTTCVGLHDRFRADAERRARILDTIRAGLVRMPVTERLQVLEALARAALEHGEKQEALTLLDEARPLVVEADILPEARVPLRARLVELRFRAGDTGAARAEVDEVLSQFEAERDQILGTERADVLRPLAETCHAMGDRPAALTLFRRVADLGAVNPNARPRAEDLAATCCSLARIGLQPDEALRARLLEIRSGLVAPW